VRSLSSGLYRNSGAKTSEANAVAGRGEHPAGALRQAMANPLVIMLTALLWLAIFFALKGAITLFVGGETSAPI
jgi:hypothetical protein